MILFVTQLTFVICSGFINLPKICPKMSLPTQCRVITQRLCDNFLQTRIIEEADPIAYLDRTEGECSHYSLVWGTQIPYLCLVTYGQVWAQHELKEASLHVLNVQIFGILIREADIGTRHLDRRWDHWDPMRILFRRIVDQHRIHNQHRRAHQVHEILLCMILFKVTIDELYWTVILVVDREQDRTFFCLIEIENASFDHQFDIVCDKKDASLLRVVVNVDRFYV